MTWIKLDDQSVDHPKIAGLSDRSFRWWIRGLCYSSRFLTDGLLPKVFYSRVPAKVRQELTAIGLWIFSDPDLSIHDYLNHQTSKEAVQRERRRNTERRTKGRTGGTTDRRTGENPRPENRDQSTEHRSNPQPPSDEGGSARIRREHRENAKAILRAQQGYCKHDQPCVNQAACCERIALELALKAKAS